MSLAIQNAIQMDRIPNAYLLTGIRGVGKQQQQELSLKRLIVIRNLDQEKLALKKNTVIAKLLLIPVTWIF